MVRRYKKVKWRDERPRPDKLWGAWAAALRPDAKDKDIQAFVDECLFSAVEGWFILMSEEGYKGTCLDFILENHDRMNPHVLSQLLGTTPTWAFDPSAQLCTADGNRIPCYGKIIDYAYEELAKKKDNKELRDKIVGYVAKREVDLSTPLCKVPTGEAVACMQKVLDDAKSTIAIEMKVSQGQSVIPALKGECRTLEENVRTSCLDKIFDNMIDYDADVKNEKYQYKDAEHYKSLIATLVTNNNMSGIREFLPENMFYDKWIEGYVSGYDKILRRLGDRGAARDALNDTLKIIIDGDAINYERFARDDRGCYHPFTSSPTTCLDAAFALMYDRSPESPTAKKYPKSSVRRFDIADRLISDVSRNVNLEDHSCTAIPQAGQGWSDQKTNCISSVLAIPAADETLVTVFDPTRLTSVVTKTCRYNAGIVETGADKTLMSIDIPCFEAALRTVTKRANLPNPKKINFDAMIRSVVLTQGTDLSKPCNRVNFNGMTSCLDLLMDLDTGNAAVDHYLMGAIKTQDLSAFKCSITKSVDTINAFDLATYNAANPTDFITKITGLGVEWSNPVEVSCLDKILIGLHQQKTNGFTAYQGVQDPYNPRGSRKYPPDYAKAGLEIVTHGGVTKSDAPCRHIYPDAEGKPIVEAIPCYQKFIEAFMPPDSPYVDGVKYRTTEPHGFDLIHEIYSDFDMSKPCKIIPFKSGESHLLPCLAAMYMKYGADHVLFLDSSGKTRSRDMEGHPDDVRCSIIGSKHFGKVTAAMKKLVENPEYRDMIGSFKGKMCNYLSCRSKPGADDGIDRRSKGKIGKIMYCHCDEHIRPDGKFTPEGATCFEQACYSTVAKFGDGPMWDDFRRFYRAGDQTPPLVKLTQVSLPDKYKLSDEISGVYEVMPRISPHDFHVRRYITEFSKVINRVYDIAGRNQITRKMQAINAKKLMEITGKKNVEDAIAAARNLTAEQMSEIDAGMADTTLTPSISLYFKKGGIRIDIPASIVKRASTITNYILEGKENEVYTKRPEWNPDYIPPDMKAAVDAITQIARGYVESDDRNIYIEISYKDRNGKPVQNFKFHEELPSRDEISLSKGQQKEIKEKKEITLPDGKIVRMKYNLFASQLVSPYRLSRLVEALPFLPTDVKDQIEHASKIAAGMPETPMKVVITSDPRDLMRASTCQRWGSCIKLEDGGRENTASVASYIKGGSYIAFITDDLNNPMWKGRTLIHRSIHPKLLAVQDRWTRDCGTEYVYGMPEFRRLLLDTVRYILYVNGYNRSDIRVAAGSSPGYLFTDYMVHPSKYLAGHPQFDQICDAFIAYYKAVGQRVTKEQCTARGKDFNTFIQRAARGGTGVREVDSIMEKANIEYISGAPWIDVEHTHGNPDRRGIECGPSQEFRAITDDDISEIVKYRGEDFVKSLGKYVRPYPTKEIP